MADAERYVTATELQAELPFNSADYPLQDEAQFSNAMTRALESASEIVETWNETVYQTTTATEQVARSPHISEHDLPLPKLPIQSVMSVDVGGTTLSESDDYRVLDTHLELVDEPAADIDKWPTSTQSVTVEWSYGYDGAPDPVREAIIRLARNSLDQIETDGYESDVDGWSYRPPAAIKSECAAMIDDYDAPSYFGGIQAI